MNNQQRPPGMPGQPPQANIPLSHTEVVPCSCGHARFLAVMELRRLPAILSQMPQDHYFLRQVSLECRSCGLEWTPDGLVKAREERVKTGPVLVPPTSESDQ